MAIQELLELLRQETETKRQAKATRARRALRKKGRNSVGIVGILLVNDGKSWDLNEMIMGL